MSVCVSVNPVCATNQELNLSELVGSLSAYKYFYFGWGLFELEIRVAITVSILLDRGLSTIWQYCYMTF